jgi:hypothetical protein
MDAAKRRAVPSFESAIEAGIDMRLPFLGLERRTHTDCREHACAT